MFPAFPPVIKCIFILPSYFFSNLQYDQGECKVDLSLLQLLLCSSLYFWAINLTLLIYFILGDGSTLLLKWMIFLAAETAFLWSNVQ